MSRIIREANDSGLVRATIMKCADKMTRTTFTGQKIKPTYKPQ